MTLMAVPSGALFMSVSGTVRDGNGGLARRMMLFAPVGSLLWSCRCKMERHL